MPKAKTTKTKKQSAASLKKIESVSRRIRRGDASRIAEMTGYEYSHVCRVLRGERNNQTIVDTAYAMVSKRKVNS